MHKVTCTFCGKTREEINSEEVFFEAPDKKTYMCSVCVDRAHTYMANRIRDTKGFKLHVVKDSL